MKEIISAALTKYIHPTYFCFTAFPTPGSKISKGVVALIIKLNTTNKKL